MNSRPQLDLNAFLPFQLSVTANAVSDVIARAYRGLFGLRVAEWRLIAILAQSPRSTPREICGLAELDKITVSRAAQALLGRGLITANKNLDDRRSHRLDLTEAGSALYHAVVPEALVLEARIVAGLSAKEVVELDALLRKLRVGVEAVNAEARLADTM